MTPTEVVREVFAEEIAASTLKAEDDDGLNIPARPETDADRAEAFARWLDLEQQ